MTDTVSLAPLRSAGPPARGSTGPWQRIFSGFGLAVLVLLALVTVAPIAYMLTTSLHSTDTAGSSWTLEQWGVLFQQPELLRAIGNSAMLCVLAIIVQSVVGALAGFAFGILRFPGSQVVLSLLIVMMLIPLQTYIIPEFVNVGRLGLVGNVPMTALIYAGTQMPFAVFILTNFFRSLPDELLESAVIDGASYPRAFISVLLPLARPALITLGVLTFIGVWNDLLVALLFLPDGDTHTVGVLLATVNSTRTFDINQVMATSLASAIPCFAVFLTFQRYLVTGLTAGIGK
ncbi:multiple sugar transport system permease protein/raffinose/stachyose/melibiose transport system permease protein [Nakamurella sp. UYEF19]|uniref:carbohydrate ABC transporter permease n=1 Tax=Nakamurella sp. UYEF19 TaxID=1756392 RepID=UPI00339455C5